MKETRLKDHDGQQVWKITLDDGTVEYMLNTQDGDNINVFSTLKELRQY